ncbi:MAG: TadE/TadG family type IV pilus assembly protein [Pseudomonadota bacterium]|nr:TadE/TadG family type IV pilus assembly protein [Pseudomonadota bacterium]
MNRKEFGAVALEFLMLFPFVIAMLYGAAVYGLTFFTQYRMQAAVDPAVSTALYVDRSDIQASSLEVAVTQRGNTALAGLVAQLPENLRDKLNTNSACGLESIAGGVQVLNCSLVYPNYETNPIVPVLSFGVLGDFPPLPASLRVEARAAF